MAATLYAVHTTGTETMNLMHVRSELLSTLGVVGSFLVYLYLPRSRRAHLYLLPMIVGAFAKTPAVIFAPLFVLYLVLFEQHLSASDLLTRQGWRSLRAALRKSVPALVVGVALFLFIEGMNAPTLTMGGGTSLEYLRTQPFVWLHYGRLFLVPTGLSADSDWGLIPHWYDTRVFAGVLFVGLLLRTLWITSKTAAQRPVAFGIGWFGLALLPASSVFPLAEVTNDHRPFLAYIGLSLALVWGLATIAERWSMTVTAPRLRRMVASGAVALAIVAIGGNAVGTYERNKVFLTAESLWADVVEKSPTNGRGLMNYGLTHMARARYDEAKALFDQAAIYNPQYPSLEINLGIVTDRLGNPVVAKAHFMKALELAPNYPAAHMFYADWLDRQGRSSEAIQHLERTLILSPPDIDARHRLLRAYEEAGRTADMNVLATETLALAPGDLVATQLLSGQGQTATGLLNLSLRLYEAGDFQGSIDAAQKALELRANYPEAHNNMAAGFASLGQWDKAIAAAREALRLRPDFSLARNNLTWAQREKEAQTDRE